MIRLATTHDLIAIDSLAVKTIQAMHAEGLFQWSLAYPRQSHFHIDIEQGVCYVYVQNGEVLGVMSVMPEREDSYREIQWIKKDSLVVHRLMVDPSTRRQGIAKSLILFAYELVSDKSLQSLKIDTHPNNLPMRSLLKSLHFVELDFLHGIHRIAYERVHHDLALTKVLIFGNSGTGKTTLTKQLSKKRNLAALPLDSVYWLPNWQSLPDETFTRKVDDFMRSNDRFVMDGNYMRSASLPKRLEAADTLIFLDYELNVALQGVKQREKEYRHRYRTDMAEGCIENVDQEFLSYIVEFNKKRRPALLRLLNSHERTKCCYVFQTREALENWLNSIKDVSYVRRSRNN